MEEKHEKKWGGKRLGAGRKKGSKKEKKQTIQITLSVYAMEILRSIPKSKSKYIESLILQNNIK